MLTGGAVAKNGRPAATVEAEAPRSAGEPIMAIVSIKAQKVTFYDTEGWIYRAPVSTGTTGRETPAGVFAVLEKDPDHHSSLYDDAWMPNMQRLTWNGIALHGGPLPGYAASHGCVRMPYEFAEKLFDKTRIGMRVIIAPDDVAPVDFSHPSLFTPKAEAATSGGFWVELARSGEEYYIPEGKKILEVLYEAGVDVDYSCELGICGECVTRVISGIPEHRDSVLSEEEQAANDKVMICCAGCKSERLVLDM